MAIPRSIAALLLMAFVVFITSGCATMSRQEDLTVQGLKNQISALEAQVEAQDDEIRALRGQLTVASDENEALSKSSTKIVTGEVKSRPIAKQIQIALRNAGFSPGPIDGKIGRKTKNAVRGFQGENGLKVDGKVGKQTWSVLKAYLSKQVK